MLEQPPLQPSSALLPALRNVEKHEAGQGFPGMSPMARQLIRVSTTLISCEFAQGKSHEPGYGGVEEGKLEWDRGRDGSCFPLEKGKRFCKGTSVTSALFGLRRLFFIWMVLCTQWPW